MLENSFPRILPDCVCTLSHLNPVRLFVKPWAVACQAPLSMDFSRQEYWSGLPCPPPGDLPDPGIKPRTQGSNPGLLCLLHWQAGSLPLAPPGKPFHDCVIRLFYSHVLLLGTVIIFFSHTCPSTHKSIRPLKLKSIGRSWGKITKAREGKDKGLWTWTMLKYCDRNSLSAEAVVNGTENN